MDSSLADYYTILGLDPEASPESVKIAFRRLARQNHPDLRADCDTEAEKALIHARMAQLNEAYAILSNPKTRREYDERLRMECALVSKGASSTAATEGRAEHAQPAAGRTQRTRMRPQYESDTTVIGELSKHLRQTLVGKRSKFAWNPVALEGFDWSLEAVTWSACHCVALRGFPILDALRAKKFVNYAEMAITVCKRPIRKNHFLFLVPFVEMTEWEPVASPIQLFLGKGSSASNLPPIGVILLDLHHGRTLRLGSRFADKRFERLIQTISVRP